MPNGTFGHKLGILLVQCFLLRLQAAYSPPPLFRKRPSPFFGLCVSPTPVLCGFSLSSSVWNAIQEETLSFGFVSQTKKAFSFVCLSELVFSWINEKVIAQVCTIIIIWTSCLAYLSIPYHIRKRRWSSWSHEEPEILCPLPHVEEREKRSKSYFPFYVPLKTSGESFRNIWTT